MLLPTTATAVLVALILSLIGWGAWAICYKATRRIRFEYFAYDFTWGVVLTTVAAAFTLGIWDSKELTFQDNLLLTGLRKMAWAAGSGVVFNLANMLLLASVSVSRLSIAFPLTFGFAWAIGSAWLYYLRPGVNPMLAFGGAAVVLVGAILAFVGYKWFLEDEAHRALKALSADPRANATPQPVDTSAKAFVLALMAGIFFAVFFYAIQETMSGDNGVASYGAALILGGGVFASSIVLVPFFLNFPVRGKPLAVRQYLQLERRQHVWGIFGGVVWTAGLLGGLVVFGLPAEIVPSPVVTFLLSHSAPLLTALIGLFLYRELPEAPVKVHAMMGAMVVLMLIGMGMMALAPIYGR
jgi:glucose uptake protein